MTRPFGASLLVPLLASILYGVAALPKITRTGRYLYDESGTRFYIKGIAYQEQGIVVASPDNPFGEPSSFIDPLSIPAACKRDLPLLQELGVNTVRIYSVNSSLNHDDCMSAFSQAGIYTIIDLALPLNGSIDRDNPTWSTNILDQYTRTIDAFSKYDNVLAYNVGNEVVVQNSTAVAPYVKAAARDIRAYLTSKGSSALVGYAAINGEAGWRGDLANFLSCDPSGSNSDSTAIDLYGLNDYEWCGDSTFQNSYAATTNAFSQYNVAAYFSEFGCVKSPPRLWTEAIALFSSDMNSVWSGGIAFSYFPASSADGQFGMVTISDDQSNVTVSDDFNRLKTEYGQISFINSPSQSSAGSATYPSCPPPSSTFLASTTLPPTPNEQACNCLASTLSCLFTPATSNFSDVVGEIINNGCSLLGSVGGSCTDIGGDGQKGVYGRVSACDPTVKASFVMSQYFESQNRNPVACSFAGNGTVNSNAPPSSSAAAAAASSCIANPNAIFTPSSAPTAGNAPGNTQSTGTGGSGTKGNGALGQPNALFGLGIMTVVTILGGIFTLA